MKDVDRAAFSGAIRERLGERPGKQRVSIMLDAAVIAFFKAKAGGRGYQTLINQALMDAIQTETLETTLRRVIRSELGASQDAPPASRAASRPHSLHGREPVAG
ncbi:MAG: BrnA antitoxin family protein [Candidatus Accumulibacter sp.]|nr:BrnA antitoxin family protein [Accumulibacter sp.]